MMVSMTVGYDYVPSDAPEAEACRRDILDKVYAKIFPHESVRAQVQAFAGSLLLGGNPSKVFALMLGERGNNGKSAFVNTFLS